MAQIFEMLSLTWDSARATRSLCGTLILKGALGLAQRILPAEDWDCLTSSSPSPETASSAPGSEQILGPSTAWATGKSDEGPDHTSKWYFLEEGVLQSILIRARDNEPYWEIMSELWIEGHHMQDDDTEMRHIGGVGLATIPDEEDS